MTVERNEQRHAGRAAILTYGFRPFFLLAGAYAVVAVAAWLAIFFGVMSAPSDWSPAYFHGHEMLFGFVTAAIAGFLLTAVPNWTGAPPLRGRALAGLVALWLAGRVVQWLAAVLPSVLVAVVDLAFLPAVAATVAPALWAAGKRSNLVILVMPTVLVVADLLVHLEVAGVVADGARLGLYLAADTIALLIAVIGGRIVPAFTRNALRFAGNPAPVAARPALDRLALASLALIVVVDLVRAGQGAPFAGPAAGVAALAAAVLNGARMAGWQSRRTLGEPLLWVLHLGYGWLVLGLLAKAAANLTDAVPHAAALHATTVGAIGTMIFAVMSRTGLGHTGRPLSVGRLIAVAYLFVSAAAITRVALPLLGRFDLMGVIVSGVFWIAAFGVFVAVYWPILTRPRADGRPG